MKPNTNGYRMVKPWTTIISNISTRVINNMIVHDNRRNFKQLYRRHGYNVISFEQPYDYQNHSNFGHLQFSGNMKGLSDAV